MLYKQSSIDNNPRDSETASPLAISPTAKIGSKTKSKQRNAAVASHYHKNIKMNQTFGSSMNVTSNFMGETTRTFAFRSTGETMTNGK